MRYMLLIYEAPEARPTMTDAEMQEDMGKWFSYTTALAESGSLISGDPLRGIDVATTVRVRGGKKLVTDGPFAETKEHLLGYYMIECADIDSALEWAAKIPSVTSGSVEVRPVMDMPPMPA